jgi:hypothetical protein
VGTTLSLHVALWFTVFQREVPEQARSRVSSYDALGSFVLVPLGAAIAGPVAAVLGIHATLIAAGVIDLVCIAVVAAQPSVWSIVDRGRAEPAVAT